MQGSMPLEEHAKQIAQETHEGAIQHMLVRVREYVRQLEEGILPIALACPRARTATAVGEEWGPWGGGGGLVDTATDGASNSSDQTAKCDYCNADVIGFGGKTISACSRCRGSARPIHPSTASWSMSLSSPLPSLAPAPACSGSTSLFAAARRHARHARFCPLG
jgi:hypothetical protein